MKKVMPQLYIASTEDAMKSIRNREVSACLCLMNTTQNELKMLCHDKKVHCTQIRIEDDGYYDIIQHFPVCNDVIAEGRVAPKGIVVCCERGISRSAAIATAYVMLVERMPWDQAIVALKERCGTTNPNSGFRMQLELWELMKGTLEGEAQAHQCYKTLSITEKFMITSMDLLQLHEGRWFAKERTAGEVYDESIEQTGFGASLMNMLYSLTVGLVPRWSSDPNGTQLVQSQMPLGGNSYSSVNLQQIPSAGNSEAAHRVNTNEDPHYGARMTIPQQKTVPASTSTEVLNK